MNLLTLRLGCARAESFGRTFSRNSINLGSPVMICKGIQDAFKEGDQLRANFETGEEWESRYGEGAESGIPAKVAMRVLAAGGIVPLLKLSTVTNACELLDRREG